MARPAAAPGVLRHLALEIPRDEIADPEVLKAVVRNPESGEEGKLADQHVVLEAARGRGRAGVDVELLGDAGTASDVHRRYREIGLVVGVGARAVLAHRYPTREIAGLEAAV